MSDNEEPAPPATPEEVLQQLAEVRGKRGYLLPHHGLLAVGDPRLLAAYDEMYTALTLAKRTLSEHAKEFVWLVILVATREAIATHHIRKMRDAGGSETEIELAIKLAAHAEGVGAIGFVGEHWAPHISGYDGVRVYREGLEALVAGSDVDPGWIEMGLAAAHTCQRRWAWLDEHIVGANQAGVEDRALFEALSLAMFPGSIPNFVDAAGRWRQLILDEKVTASPSFQAWAHAPGQGGYDEAVGVAET
ncbi:MAG: hypothetical protein HOL85_18735 [Rhodospirillaceae bacterium]|mgnify:FL=1|nr:hypothetical protein [Rhodospirillaceae bacterium]MBT6137560.1 hypothetical protein [Rhodospirillaceae bacterium]